MEPTDAELRLHGMLRAHSHMCDVLLTMLQVALENEDRGGFTATGARLEPPLGQMVRPVLDVVLRDQWDLKALPTHAEDQHRVVLAAYRQQMTNLRDQILSKVYPYET